MPGLDPNIILAGSGNIAPPPNPLTISGQVAALQNARAQNQLLQNSNTEFQQKQAAGRIVSNALMARTDANGNVDYNSARGDIAARGYDNPMIADALTQNLQQQGAQTANSTALAGLDQAKVGSYLAQSRAVAAGVSPLLASKSPITTDQVASQIAQLTGDPALHGEDSIAGQGASLIANAPKNATPQQTDQYWRQTLGGIALRATDAATQLSAYTGTPTAINDGAQTNFETINPVAGTVTPLNGPSGSPAVITNRLSPGEQAGLALQRVNTVDPTTGAPVSVSAMANAGKPLATGLAPGQAAAGEFGTQRSQQISAAAESSPTRIAAIQDARSVIGSAPATAFGPTGHLTSQVGKLALAFGVAPPSAANGQVSIEELTKSLSLIAANQAQALGAGTDASRAAVAASNPSLMNSKAGVQQLLSVVQGNEQYIIAKNRALQMAQQNGLQPAQVRQFETQFNQQISPLVFQTQYMDPAARARVYNSLPKPQQQALVAGRALALKYGWLDGQ